MFFDPRRYDLAKVGRYKFNKKLHLNRRIVGHRLAEDVVDASTGEILAEEGTVVTKEMANTIQNSAVPYVWILGEEDRRIKVLSNLMVDIRHYLPEIEDPKSIGVTEAVYRFNIDQGLWRNILCILSCHSLTNHTFQSGKTDSVLVLKQLTYRTYTTVAKVIDIIGIAKAIFQMHIVVKRSKDVFFCDMLRNQIMDISVDCCNPVF